MSRAEYEHFLAARLGAQLVRFEQWSDAAGDYEKLIQQRRAAIAADLNAFVGIRKELTDG